MCIHCKNYCTMLLQQQQQQGGADGPPTYRPTDAGNMQQAQTMPGGGKEHPTYQPTDAKDGGTQQTSPTSPIDAGSGYAPEVNPHIDRFNTTEWRDFVRGQWEERAANAIEIREKYGVYCDKNEDGPFVPMCPELSGSEHLACCLNSESDVVWDAAQLLRDGPKFKCADTGDKTERCGANHQWLNKTIWPIIRSPLCAEHDAEREEKYPLPDELQPHFDLGYDRSSPKDSVGKPRCSTADRRGKTTVYSPSTATRSPITC